MTRGYRFRRAARVTILFGILTHAVPVFEIDPEVLDGFALQLRDDTRADGGDEVDRAARCAVVEREDAVPMRAAESALKRCAPP
jgi:hypothetical protein